MIAGFKPNEMATKVIVDIETIHPWQKDLVTGFQKGEMSVITAGRRTGKSFWANMVQDLTQPNIQHLDSAPVDDKIWHTVKLNMLTAEWIRQQDASRWYAHTPTESWGSRNIFDIEESLYTMLVLKWKQ